VSVTTADFNGDGRPDLAVALGASRAGGGVFVLLGNGDGTFQRKIRFLFETIAIPASVIAGDFNADGKVDLAVANSGNNTVSILLGRGDGTFGIRPDFIAGASPSSLSAGDFNGDGGVDLAVVSGGRVSVLLNDPTIAILPTKLSFGKQPIGTTSGPKPVLLSNASVASLGIGSITVAGANAGDFDQTSTCDAKVLPGANCTISVTFTPKAAGTRNAALALSDNALARHQTVALAGVATAPAVLLATSLNFANQVVGTTSAPNSVSLTNTGNATLHIASIGVGGDFAQTNNCGPSVAPGTSCTVSVTFTPTAKGDRTGSFTIADDALDSPQTISLTGRAR
jgi:hypothetical protein